MLARLTLDRSFGRQRDKLRTELTTVVDDLSDGAEFLQANLRLLEDPHALYMGASDEIRRKLNQSIFKHIFVANEEVVGDEINSPLAELLAAQHGFRAQAAGLNEGDALDQAFAELLRHSAPTTRATLQDGSCAVTVEDLLTGIDTDVDSSKPSMVGVLRNYCNRNLATRQVDELIEEACGSIPTDRSGRRIPDKASPKLAPDQVRQLVAYYEQGDSINQLSRRFGIHRETVKDHLRRAGIEIRPGNQA